MWWKALQDDIGLVQFTSHWTHIYLQISDKNEYHQVKFEASSHETVLNLQRCEEYKLYVPIFITSSQCWSFGVVKEIFGTTFYYVLHLNHIDLLGQTALPDCEHHS